MTVGLRALWVEITGRVIGAMAAAYTLLQGVVWIAAKTTPFLTGVAITVVVLAAGVLTWRVTRRPRSVAVVGTTLRDSVLGVSIGDLFDLEHTWPAIVTVDRSFNLLPPEANPQTLISRVAELYYGSEPEKLRAAISEARGHDGPGEVGELVVLTPGQRQIVLFALPRRDDNNLSQASVGDIMTAFSRLWSGCEANGLTEVDLPIIGAGFAGAAAGPVPLLSLLLSSYHLAAHERRIPRAHVYIPENRDAPELIRVAQLFADSMRLHTNAGKK